ncbi:MAG: ZIP family metal transporter [Candidatus Diapherotrites archaeon]|nr:ZIP family metal transporter [Candidatus Diapherotrites archaeon]
MAYELFYIMTSTFIISLLSLTGLLTLRVSKKKFNKMLLLLVSFSGGALMGGAFLHLLPEAAGLMEARTLFDYTLLGFLFFFFVEKVLHWQHCHEGKCEVHTFTYMSLFGDGIHNFIDGLVIAASFMTSFPLGVASAIAIALHEIPQEIGELGVLIYGGFKKEKAIILNFVTSSSAFLGGLIGFFAFAYLEPVIKLLIPIAAGGFIYIAASDFLPEIRKAHALKDSITTFFIFLLGISFMYVTRLIMG